jgi:hypothetical protein
MGKRTDIAITTAPTEPPGNHDAKANTRIMVLGKQETRVKENLKEVENKINEMIRGMQAGGSSSAGSTGGAGPRSLG